MKRVQYKQEATTRLIFVYSVFFFLQIFANVPRDAPSALTVNGLDPGTPYTIGIVAIIDPGTDKELKSVPAEVSATTCKFRERKTKFI